MGIRRKAREVSLQLLYEMDLAHKLAPQVLERVEDLLPQDSAFSQEHQQEFCDFIKLLVEGVGHNRHEIDQLIESHSTHWKISRMALVDRNILRMAVFELLDCKDIPTSVTLNEAIEIGKSFGTEESAAFINGVLDHIAKDLKKERE